MSWSTWAKWTGSIEQTFHDAQQAAAGEESLGDAKRRATKSGTPGILTVETLADHRMLGRIWVLGAEELHAHFGSKAPPKRAIEAGQTAFVEGLEEGQAVAVTAWARGQPTAVLFAGQPVKRR